jgi:hypothetical protein
MMIVSVLSAQHSNTQDNQKQPVRYVSQMEAQIARDNGVKLQTTVDRGDAFFYEDFSNGFDGNNGWGAWTAGDSGGDQIWMSVDVDGEGTYFDGTLATDDDGDAVTPPGGEFSTNIGSLQSTTADNGWVIFDADFYNSPIADGVEDVEGSLTSPVLDMSGLSSVIVEWEQYFRYCCFSFSPVFLEVSNDGGANWITFPANGTFITSANTASANPLPTSVDVSCAAAGYTEVQIRFSYLQNPITGNGYSHYYWGIDDVAIVENPSSNDLALNQITNGDIFNIWEYKTTPIEQARPAAGGGVLAGTIYHNAGSADQTNVTITIEILDDAENVLSTTEVGPLDIPAAANGENCPQYLQDTLYTETGWEPTTVGDYILRQTITSADFTDESPDDNVMEMVISYTDCEYGHADDATLDVEFSPRESDVAGLFDPTGYGSFFTNPNEGSTAYGITVRFGPNTAVDVDLEFEARIYSLPLGTFLNDGEFESTYYEVDPSFVPASIAASEFVYLPFEDPIELLSEDEGSHFAGIITEFESEGELTVLGNSNSDTDNSTGQYELSGGGDFIWFSGQTATPAIRLIYCAWTDVDDFGAKNGMLLDQNAPNPVTGVTTIRYELASAKDVVIEITDLQGRTIDSFDLGTLASGPHSFEYDASNLSTGVYQYSLVANGVRMTKKMMVTKK